MTQLFPVIRIRWIVIYPVDSAIQLLNNLGLVDSAIQLLNNRGLVDSAMQLLNNRGLVDNAIRRLNSRGLVNTVHNLRDRLRDRQVKFLGEFR